MDENEFRAEIAGIFHEQDRRMEKLDKKLDRLENKIEKNAAAIEKNAVAIEKNAVAIKKNASAVSKLTSLWTDFVETYTVRDVKKDENISDLDRRIKRIERKLGLN